MAQKKSDKVGKKILEILFELGEMLPRPFETPYQHIRRTSGIPRFAYNQHVARLKRRGVVMVKGKRVAQTIQLTSKGRLEVLLWKAKLPGSKSWDGRWRLVMFDIPENSRRVRDRLRALLKRSGFRSLQESVYISPYALNRSALVYLRETGLIHFIRILRVDDIDDDRDLKSIFGMRVK